MASKGRILFVDSDSEELGELRRQAYLLGWDWETVFAAGATQGLRAMAKESFGAVVADLRLAEMDGTRFLQEVMARSPGTVRFLLAADEDREAALRGLARAHQFLAKPCNLRYLKSILEFASAQGRQVANDHLRELVTRIGQLPAVPDLYRQITELMESDRGSVDQVGAVIAQDPAMTAMILKLANSAFFSFRQPVTCAKEAVACLGIDMLKALVLAHGLFGQVGAMRIPSFTLQHLWQHCLSVAAASRCIALAEDPGLRSANACFTAGMLHDVGILILASRFPDDYGQALDTLQRSGGDLETAEFHAFGATHSDVGAYLLALWGLPGPVVQAAAHHHAIGRQPSKGFCPALAVHVADFLCGQKPDHLAFSRVSLDEAYLASAGLADRLPVWQAAVQKELHLA